MRKPLCIGSSDWHLERNAWVRYPDLQSDSYYALEQIVNWCLRHKAPLIAAGDLFDKPYPDSKSVWVAIQQLDRMNSADLHVYYTQGQHERAREQPWLGLHPWATHIHNKTVELNGLRVSGLDYTRPDQLKSSLAIAKLSDIFVCHQVWRDFMGSVVTVDGCLSHIPMSGKLVITGDYHRHANIEVIPDIGGSPNNILSPGSTCLQSIDEPPKKFVYLIYDDLSWESLPLKSRQVFYHEILKEQDLEDFLSTINMGWLEDQLGVPRNIAKPILSVKYNPDIKDVYAEIVSKVGDDRAHLFIRPITRELDVRVVEMDTAQETIDLGLEGNLAKLCDPESLTYTIARRLLLSASPKEELITVEEEYLNQKESV